MKNGGHRRVQILQMMHDFCGSDEVLPRAIQVGLALGYAKEGYMAFENSEFVPFLEK